MSTPAVPHRPARRRPAMPSGGPIEVAPPPGPPPPGPGWLAGVLPAVATVPVLALGATGHARGTGLLLALLVIPAVGGTVAVYAAQRRRQRRDARRARDRWRTHLATCVAQAAAAADEQRLALDRLHPADLAATVAAGAAFERRPDDPDALTVAVGCGPVAVLRPLALARLGPLAEVSADLAADADRAVSAAAHLPAAVVTVDLTAARVLAVVGAAEETAPVLARIAGELAALHAPGELALAGGGPGVEVGRLPHARGTPTGADPGAVAGWLTATPQTALRVAVVAGYRPGDCPDLDAALAEPTTVAVVGCPDHHSAPAAAGAVLDVAARTLRGAEWSGPLDLVETLEPAAAQTLVAVLERAAPDRSTGRPDLATLLARPRGQELEVPIGLDPAGRPVLLRLAESAAGGDGPHGLLVGATGSGKSVLLRTVVVGLAARHSPAELTLLLVDYKGGAAFGPLAGLPHVAGLVTNLADTPALLGRVALALGAELDRRQRLLRDAGAESRRALHGTWPPLEAARAVDLPTLLVVVDEAGELLAADPGVADVFARVGRVGRSLGVHLLLSTQHWDGGRMHHLDAHLRYRLCLRTVVAEDSRAVLGDDAATRLPARSGAGWLAVDGVSRRVDVLAPPDDPHELVPAWSGRTEPVWLPPLPAALAWPADGTLGRIDRPAGREQPALRVDWSGPGGHVAVAGGPRSGVSTTLRAVVLAAGEAAGAGALHVHVLDLAGGLADLAAWPQVGTVAGMGQPALVRAVVAAVHEELVRRAAGAAGPRLLLVVDGAGLLRSDDGAAEAMLADLAARGLAHDVHLVLGARRWSELRGGVFEACGTRIELHLGDPAESLAGRAAAGQVPAGVPGRGLLPDGTAVQIARPDAGRPAGRPGQVPPVVLLPARIREPPASAFPPPTHALPPPVGRREAAVTAGFPLGVGGSDARAMDLDLLAPGAHLVISGDAGSGRTTVLRRLVRHLAAAGPGRVAAHVVDPRRGLLAVAPLAASWSHAPPAAAEMLAALTATLRGRLPDPAAGLAELTAAAARPPDPRARQIVLLDDFDLLDSGGLAAGPLPAALAALAELLPYAPEIGLHLVVVRPTSVRGLDPLTARLRACAPWTLQLPGEHLEGPAAGRAAPALVGRALLGRGAAPAVALQCYTDDP